MFAPGGGHGLIPEALLILTCT